MFLHSHKTHVAASYLWGAVGEGGEGEVEREKGRIGESGEKGRVEGDGEKGEVERMRHTKLISKDMLNKRTEKNEKIDESPKIRK